MKTINSEGYDRWVLLIVLLLIIVGLTAVYSSTAVISSDAVKKYQQYGITANQFEFVKRQFFTVVLGIFAMFIAYKIKLSHMKKAAIPLLIVSLILLLLVFSSLGVSGGGARRWIQLWPSTFQPSELVKLTMIIFLSWYMSMHSYKTDKILFFAIPVGIMVVFQVIFELQRDFGAIISLGLLTVSMLFLSGVKLRYLFLLSIIAAPIIAKMLLEPYRWSRMIFLDPWRDPHGSGYQLIQSFIALGSGGLTGVGLGEGRQKLLFLPEVHTDFIFSMIGEEVGFIGAITVVFLFFALFLMGIAIAKKTVNPFSYYLCFGISIMIALQAITNLAVVTGMAPTKGMPLPFISFGGSALIVNMTAIGLLLNISKDNTKYIAPQTTFRICRSSISHNSYGYRQYGKIKEQV